jgi:hypothetical protein
VHDVRAEFERIFEELESRPAASAIGWDSAGKLCLPQSSATPRAQPLARAQPNTPALTAGVRVSSDLSTEEVEAERLEVERELAWIRQAMHSRLEYLESHETQHAGAEHGAPDAEPLALR